MQTHPVRCPALILRLASDLSTHASVGPLEMQAISRGREKQAVAMILRRPPRPVRLRRSQAAKRTRRPRRLRRTPRDQGAYRSAGRGRLRMTARQTSPWLRGADTGHGARGREVDDCPSACKGCRSRPDEEMFQRPGNRMPRIDAADAIHLKHPQFPLRRGPRLPFSPAIAVPIRSGFASQSSGRVSSSGGRRAPSETPPMRAERSAGVEAQEPDARPAAVEMDIGPHIRFGESRDARDGWRPPGRHTRHGKQD